ncbi:MAG: hypothetical protein ACE148_14500 [Vicinamibacterales bacterium]
MAGASPQHLLQHPLDLALPPPDVGLDLRQRAQWLVLVEVPGQWNLVAYLRLRLVNQASGTCGRTSRSKYAWMSSFSGTFS